MAQITIYQKPTCSTCRTVIRLVQETGQPFTAVNYYEQPLSKPRLKALLKKGGLRASDVMRTKEERYKTLGLVDNARCFDPITGMARQSAIPVNIRAASVNA